MNTFDLCEKFNIPLPPSVWEKHGLEVPEFQKVSSGRIVRIIPENMRNPPAMATAAAKTGQAGAERLTFSYVAGDGFEAAPQEPEPPLVEQISYNTKRFRQEEYNGGPAFVDMVTSRKKVLDIMPKTKKPYE